MMREPSLKPKNFAASARENRLKAALKANMGRRKAQALARGADEAGEASDQTVDGSATTPKNTE